MTMVLPEEFIRYTKSLMGEQRFTRYMAAFDEEPPVSIRLNPHHLSLEPNSPIPADTATRSPFHYSLEEMPWCRNAYYLDNRPVFTFDPLFHAGCYYVQEAASMFLDEVLRQKVNCQLANGQCLDLCAAPGGKSTLLRSFLPEDCMLISNEPIRSRANILLENVTKWGYERHYVTNSYPRDFRKARMKFDLILCDVPCSGEGMFRKDQATIGEWSMQNVERCWQLQRDIVSDAWACLNDGGLLIYSTCTFNTKENEENVRWMLDTFDAQVLPVQTQAEWGITGSLLAGFTEPVCRFIPGITRGEGLFMAVLQKGGTPPSLTRKQTGSLDELNSQFGRTKLPVCLLQTPALHVAAPRVELTYPQAIAYLRREALILPPDTPRGIVEVCFQGHGLGTVKNIGSRANNLYPKEWAIKTTHVPQEYTPVL